MATYTIKHGVLGRTQGAESNLPTDLEWGGQNAVTGWGGWGGRCDEKGVKYLIYLPWRRETNAFTVIEDASPSHTNTHILMHTFWLKEERAGKSRAKLIFLKQNGNRKREGKVEFDGERRSKSAGEENTGGGEEAKIGGNKRGRGSEADRNRWTE